MEDKTARAAFTSIATLREPIMAMQMGASHQAGRKLLMSVIKQQILGYETLGI